MTALAVLVGGALFMGLMTLTDGAAAIACAGALFGWHVVGQLVEWLQSIHDRRVALRRWASWERHRV